MTPIRRPDGSYVIRFNRPGWPQEAAVTEIPLQEGDPEGHRRFAGPNGWQGLYAPDQVDDSGESPNPDAANEFAQAQGAMQRLEAVADKAQADVAEGLNIDVPDLSAPAKDSPTVSAEEFAASQDAMAELSEVAARKDGRTRQAGVHANAAQRRAERKARLGELPDPAPEPPPPPNLDPKPGERFPEFVARMKELEAVADASGEKLERDPFKGVPGLERTEEKFPETDRHDTKAQDEAALRAALREVLRADNANRTAIVQMLLEHAARIDELTKALERGRL